MTNWTQRAIEDAGSAGWKENENPEYAESQTGRPIVMLTNKRLVIEEVLLDPAFWQALGKARGWDDHIKQSEFENRCWRCRWHRLIDQLASGRDIESFFEGLYQD